MVFKAKNAIQAEAPVLQEEIQTESNENLDFLTPAKDANKEMLNDPYGAEMTQKSAHQYTLKTLNALGIVSRIVCALMEKPGVDAPSEEMTGSFRHLIQETSTVAQNFCEKMGIDPTKEKNFWVRNVLERNFAEILKTQWINHGKTNIEQLNDLVDDILKVAQTTSENSPYEDISDKESISLNVIKAQLIVLSEIKSGFDLYRNTEEDLEPIAKKLFDTSAEAVKKLASEYATEESRAKLFNMVIQQAATLYSIAWKSETQRVDSVMKQYPPEKLQKVVEKYKNSGGFPLNRVDYDFEKYFAKMIVITEKLVKSQKGTLEKRLKNK